MPRQCQKAKLILGANCLIKNAILIIFFIFLTIVEKAREPIPAITVEME